MYVLFCSYLTRCSLYCMDPMAEQVKILRRKLDDMERSYDVLLDEVKQMRLRVEGKDSHASQPSPGDADKTHEEKIQARPPGFFIEIGWHKPNSTLL